MNDFEALGLGWYRQHLDEIAANDMKDIIDTAVDLALKCNPEQPTSQKTRRLRQTGCSTDGFVKGWCRL